MDAGRRSERDLVERLQRGDEQAFIALVERYQTQMIRVALRFVPTPEVAEDVVQDAWLGVVRGIDRFGGQSSLRTWLFHIVANRARTAGAKERLHTRRAGGEPLEDPTRFAPDGTWAAPLPHWSDEVDDRMTAESLTACIHRAISNLPPTQRLVVTMRDIEGLSNTEVCKILSLRDGQQRVLLHRGRAAIRRVLENQLVAD